MASPQEYPVLFCIVHPSIEDVSHSEKISVTFVSFSDDLDAISV